MDSSLQNMNNILACISVTSPVVSNLEIQHPNPPDGFYSHDNTTTYETRVHGFCEVVHKIEGFINTIGICSIKTGNDTVNNKPIAVFNIDVFFRYTRIRSIVYITSNTENMGSTVHYYRKAGDRYAGTKLFYVMINKSGLGTLQIPRLLMPVEHIGTPTVHGPCINIIDMLSEPFVDQVQCAVSHILREYCRGSSGSDVQYIHTVVKVLSKFCSDNGKSTASQHIIPITATLVSKILPDAIDAGITCVESDLSTTVECLTKFARNDDADPICARACLHALYTIMYKVPRATEILDRCDIADAVLFSGPCAINVASSCYLRSVSVLIVAKLGDLGINPTACKLGHHHQSNAVTDCYRMRKVLTDERIRIEDSIANNSDAGKDMRCVISSVIKQELYFVELIIANRENSAQSPCVKLSQHAYELRAMLENTVQSV